MTCSYILSIMHCHSHTHTPYKAAFGLQGRKAGKKVVVIKQLNKHAGTKSYPGIVRTRAG
ncbi:hypothetical protein K438DRAFT_1857101 [Mycena galopus ATCC 62051]|nr:hypothetical protein K438DRAFT_1857101 [Mycena galopus ATCC 62051]